MSTSYKNIICIHPLDVTTEFLTPIGNAFGDNYYLIRDNDDSHNYILKILRQANEYSLIIFLGHGSSIGLYSADTNSYMREIFIDKALADILFKDHDVLLLACHSADFINKVTTYNSSIGFGNIISSRQEILNEAEYTGVFRQLEQSDLDQFNQGYLHAIDYSLKLLLQGDICFSELKSYILYFINKEINNCLLNYENQNRLELSRILFEFRDEVFQKFSPL